MGIGLPGQQGVGAAHHRGGDVGVQVEGGHHRGCRADQRAHRADQVALRVADVLGRGGAVQRQQYAIHRQRRLQPLEDFALQLLVGVPCERAAGAGAGVQQGHRRQAPLAQHLQHPGHRAAGARQQLVAAQQFVALVPGAVDRRAAEVVALGEDRPDRYARLRRGGVQPAAVAPPFGCACHLRHPFAKRAMQLTAGGSAAACDAACACGTGSPERLRRFPARRTIGSTLLPRVRLRRYNDNGKLKPAPPSRSALPGLPGAGQRLLLRSIIAVASAMLRPARALPRPPPTSGHVPNKDRNLLHVHRGRYDPVRRPSARGRGGQRWRARKS